MSIQSPGPSGTYNGCGVTVTTNRDYTTVIGPVTFLPGKYAPPGIIVNMGFVTAVSMNIPWANRIAGNSGQSVTFAFTAASSLPSGGVPDMQTNNYIQVNFPPNFFTKNVAGTCVAPPAVVSVTGLPGDYTFLDFFSAAATQCTDNVPCVSFRITSPSNAALSAGSYTMTVNGLTFGAATAGNDAGIQIQTPLDRASSACSSGPLSGYNVTAFKLPTCRASSSCQSVAISFMSNAGTIFRSSTLNIFFDYAIVSGSTSITVGGALLTGSVINNMLTLTVDPNFAPYTPDPANLNTITLTGMTIVAATKMDTGITVSMSSGSLGQSTKMYSASVAPSSSGLTTTTSLVIAAPFVSSINTVATVSFTTINPINIGDVIYIFFPAGFFISTPVSQTCIPNNFGGSRLSMSIAPTSCSIYQSCYTGFNVNPGVVPVPYNASMSSIMATVYGAALPPGPKTIVIRGLNMNNVSTVASTSSFYVLTTQDACSAGAIPTGDIVTAPPPSAASAAEAPSSIASAGVIAGAVIGSVVGKSAPKHSLQRVQSSSMHMV
jgi:hypothetical protein